MSVLASGMSSFARCLFRSIALNVYIEIRG